MGALGMQSPGLQEIGKQAVWSLSTAKPGNGVEQIRDDSTETYWQSDGTVGCKGLRLLQENDRRITSRVI